jgi:hypothetical protein
MIHLHDVLIAPRRIHRRRVGWPRFHWSGFGLVFAPAILWLLLAALLRAVVP